MKFLILEKPFPVPGTPESMKASSRALEASVKMFDDLKRRGKLECVYGFAGIAGGFAILDVKSHEELEQLIMQIPITAFGQIEVYPLADLKESSEILKKVVAQMG